MTYVGDVVTSVGTALPRTLALLTKQVTEDRVCTGAQLFVSVDGSCLADVALGSDGLGRPNRIDTLYALYCATKPLTALAVAQLVGEGRISYDDDLGTLLGADMSPTVGRLRLREVLDHTAGLHAFTSFWAVFTGEENRDHLLRNADGPPDDSEAGYSEYGSWHLLGKVVDSTTGVGLMEYVRTRIIDPAGLSGHLYLGMSDREYAESLGRFGVNVEMRPGVHAPLLYERTRQACTEYNPGSGGRGTARGLGLLYEHLVGVLAGRVPMPILAPTSLAAMTDVSRPATATDAVLRRPCAFGLGFMVRLEGHGFGGRISERAFGHAGYTGMSFGFGDPDHGLALAAVYNGHTDFETSLRRRSSLCNGLYDELGFSRGPVG